MLLYYCTVFQSCFEITNFVINSSITNIILIVLYIILIWRFIFIFNQCTPVHQLSPTYIYYYPVLLLLLYWVLTVLSERTTHLNYFWPRFIRYRDLCTFDGKWAELAATTATTTSFVINYDRTTVASAAVWRTREQRRGLICDGKLHVINNRNHAR